MEFKPFLLFFTCFTYFLVQKLKNYSVSRTPVERVNLLESAAAFSFHGQLLALPSN